MANLGKVLRASAKLAAGASVEIMIGGVMAAVVPGNVGPLFKAVAGLGTVLVAAFASDKMETYVDSKCDEVRDMVQETVDEAKRNIDILRQIDKDTDTNEA